MHVIEVGCDCMKEDGTVLLVAVGLNDSEEHGVKNSLNSGGGGGGGQEDGGSDERALISIINRGIS